MLPLNLYSLMQEGGMPKAKRYTEKRFVMLTPAQARQLERLSRHHEVSVPDLIRTALRQHY